MFSNIVQTVNGIKKAHASKMNTQEMYDKKWADYRLQTTPYTVNKYRQTARQEPVFC